MRPRRGATTPTFFAFQIEIRSGPTLLRPKTAFVVWLATSAKHYQTRMRISAEKTFSLLTANGQRI
jgi:hypothetical protein